MNPEKRNQKSEFKIWPNSGFIVY